jgi:hypothetical protein
MEYSKEGVISVKTIKTKIIKTLKDIYAKATCQYYTIEAQRKRNGEAIDLAERAGLIEDGKQNTRRNPGKLGIG